MNAREVLKQAVAGRTLIDRAIEKISPTRGLERLRARAKLSAALFTGGGGYVGGLRDRRATKWWRPAASSADTDTVPDLKELRSRSRDLERNTPIATGAISTVLTNVVGDGLMLQPEPDRKLLRLSDAQAEELEKQISREWALFCKSADFTRVQCFPEMQPLALRAVMQSGDMLVVRRWRADPGDIYGTKLQFVEADRLSNPNSLIQTAVKLANGSTRVAGVEVDAHGVHKSYTISDRHPGDTLATALNWTTVQGRTSDGEQVVLHLFDRLRPDQTRGVPYLAPVIEHLKQLGDYSDAECAAAVVAAMLTVFVETPNDTQENPTIGETDPALASNEIALGSGAVVSLNPGEKANMVNPMRPNQNFDPFWLSMTRQIGVALELPHELLIKHFTASYSASRAALEMAWQFFRRRRSWLARSFCQVIYEWFFAEAVLIGRINAPGYFDDPVIRAAYCKAVWHGPNRISVDPKKEAEADGIDIKNCVKTRQQVILERTGGDFDDKVVQLAREQAAITNAGLNQAPAANEQPGAAPEDRPERSSDYEDEAA